MKKIDDWVSDLQSLRCGWEDLFDRRQGLFKSNQAEQQHIQL
jgi:hypothetical protein